MYVIELLVLIVGICCVGIGIAMLVLPWFFCEDDEIAVFIMIWSMIPLVIGATCIAMFFVESTGFREIADAWLWSRV